jgi:hypothetical protein
MALLVLSVELLKQPVSSSVASNENRRFTLGPPQLLLGSFLKLYEEVIASSIHWRTQLRLFKNTTFVANRWVLREVGCGNFDWGSGECGKFGGIFHDFFWGAAQSFLVLRRLLAARNSKRCGIFYETFTALDAVTIGPVFFRA